ncbi:MAG: tRNA (adenosine(37)-N6)-threonylcarbamoyltransferase complex transferase subunit TsaD [Leptospirales bacterium]
MILGIETSCDDTSVALVDKTGAILFHHTHSQDNLHRSYGGVVPEVACRAHVKMLPSLVREALQTASISPSDLSGIAVTQGPGLLGSLLTGISFAKGLASPDRIPIIGVDHIKAHLRASISSPDELGGKSIGLVISGGHTHLYRISSWPKLEKISQTVDDAAGEAFDKGAKLLGLPYPGGPSLQHEADKNIFPILSLTKRAVRTENALDFSFSGLKTAFALLVRKSGVTEENRPQLAASLQEAIVSHVMDRIERVFALETPDHLLVGGGVSANALLREKLKSLCREKGICLHLSPLELSRDNALMVANIGAEILLSGIFHPYPYFDLIPFTRDRSDCRSGKSTQKFSRKPG